MNFGIFLFVLFPCLAQADALPELTKQISRELKAHVAASASPSHGKIESWFFRNIYLRLQGSAGIRVPWIATFEIVPEVELVWQRPLPPGVINYRP